MRVSEQLDLTMVQLHGDEGPAFCLEVVRRTGAKVVKAVQVSDVGDLQDVERFHSTITCSTRARAGRPELRGGTGGTFDWALLSAVIRKVPLILSGGLGPGNVAEAIALVRPFAVDTASGTESSPGHKDPERLADFFAEVQRVSVGSPA